MYASDDIIKVAMSNTGRVDLRVVRVFEHPKKLFKSVPVEGRPGETTIEPVMDADGKQAIELEEMVEYETTCGGVNSRTEARVKDLMAVNYDTADDDDWVSNNVKARAKTVMEQIQAKRMGTMEIVPAGHTGLEAWGQLSAHAVASLKHARIYSVQQLAEASEATIQRIPSGLQPSLLRQQAVTHLRQVAAAALPTALMEERAKTAKLEAKVDQMAAMLEKFLNAGLANGASGEDEAPKRRGRAPMPRDANGEIIRDQEAA
jgi:hypothetical protein